MLVIRDEQLRILNKPSQANFRKQVSAYIQSEFPARFEALGTEGVRDLIELGIRKADQYGFELEAEICDLIGVMAEFGADVDQKPWASAILRDSEPANVRIGRLTGWAEALRRFGGRR
jgi:hypothetical protein